MGSQKVISNRLVSFIFRVGVSISVLTALLWWLPLNVILKAVKQVPVEVWLLMIAGFLTGQILSAFKWRSLLYGAGVSVSWFNAVQAHAAGLSANLFLKASSE